MKRLFLTLSLLVIGCSSNSLGPQEDCYCGLEISSNLPQSNGIYELEYDASLAQTYTVLSCQTECGWSQHIQWDSDYQYQIVPGQWTSLVNPASMTDEYGGATIIFGTWEEFIGDTIVVWCGYTDDCDVHHLDSLKIKIIDNE